MTFAIGFATGLIVPALLTISALSGETRRRPRTARSG